MTPLRQKMIDAMRVRGFSMRTHQSYLAAVTELARYTHRSPDQLKVEELLTCREVRQIIRACNNPKHHMLLELCYGCGLRVSEVVAVRVRHLDGERRLLRIEQGKGAKDRAVILSPGLLEALRRYWRRYRPVASGRDPGQAPSRDPPRRD